MAVYFVDVFKYNMVQAYFGEFETQYLHLLTSANGAYPVSYAFDYASYTASESAFKGYTMQVLTGLTFTNDTTNHQTIISFPTATFSYNSAESGNASETVDGFCITNGTGGATIAVGSISPGKVISTDGDEIIITFSSNVFEDVAGTIDPVS